jgi:hypothetical protein
MLVSSVAHQHQAGVLPIRWVRTCDVCVALNAVRKTPALCGAPDKRTTYLSDLRLSRGQAGDHVKSCQVSSKYCVIQMTSHHQESPHTQANLCFFQQVIDGMNV